MHYPEVDIKVTVRAKETVRDPIFGGRHTLYSITSEVSGTINLTNIQESAEKLNLKIHTPIGDPSLSVEDAIELAEFIGGVLA
ncbi:hypothetical protein [Bacillus sp. FSL R7-0685]|uniref:hypothetical protein n=1 Tax=Bacillus sp. FSL R7-0685 TaxID=2921589 RepID=UPI0030F9E2CC